MAKADLTVERLREVLLYEPESGVFTRKIRTTNFVKVGDVAGSETIDGYLRIMIDGTHYYAHRLAWLYVLGTWPTDQLDHANGSRLDNRLANLRESNQSENCQNRGVRNDNTSGVPGVSWSEKKGKWVAQIMVGGKYKHIGRYKSFEAACDARASAQATLFQFQPVPRHLLTQQN